MPHVTGKKKRKGNPLDQADLWAIYSKHTQNQTHTLSVMLRTFFYPWSSSPNTHAHTQPRPYVEKIKNKKSALKDKSAQIGANTSATMAL